MTDYILRCVFMKQSSCTIYLDLNFADKKFVGMGLLDSKIASVRVIAQSLAGLKLQRKLIMMIIAHELVCH